MPQLSYKVSKENYMPNSGMEIIEGSTVDLGEIELNSFGLFITHFPVANEHKNPTACRVFSLNGQILYSGTAASVQSHRIQALMAKQPVIIQYLRNNCPVFTIKRTIIVLFPVCGVFPHFEQVVFSPPL
jgi:hypothetical protein